jgi:hypothetical protein
MIFLAANAAASAQDLSVPLSRDLALTVNALTVPSAALPQGQGNPTENAVLRQIGALFSVGGFFPTAGSGQRALGDSKFFNNLAIYVRPAKRGSFLIAAGLQIVSAQDHFFPFTGSDNELDLYGLSVGVTTPRAIGRLRFNASFGLFAGRLRSSKLGFDVTDFTPAGTVGLDWPFTRYLTATAGYSISEDIHGVNVDGFYIGLRIF